MSGAMSRRKGAVAERAVVSWLRDNGYPNARRILAGDGRQDGDVAGVPLVCLEVKNCKRPAWPAWMRQAWQESTPAHDWVVVVRKTPRVTDVARWEARWTPRNPGGAPWQTGTFAECMEAVT